MARKDKIIRIGDVVKIINPLLFLSCEYERNIYTIKQEIRDNQGEMKRIRQFLSGMLAGDPELFIVNENDYRFERSMEHVIHGIAYYRINLKSGNKRILRTEEYSSLLGHKCVVTGIFYRKTGEYSPAEYHYGGYWGEEDYVPAFLDKEKTHKILILDHSYHIEATNVEKINEGVE
jgi:hypothetical protein